MVLQLQQSWNTPHAQLDILQTPDIPRSIACVLHALCEAHLASEASLLLLQPF